MWYLKLTLFIWYQMQICYWHQNPCSKVTKKMTYRIRIEEDELRYLKDAIGLEYDKLADRMREKGEVIPMPFHRLSRRVNNIEERSAGQKVRYAKDRRSRMLTE